MAYIAKPLLLLYISLILLFQLTLSTLLPSQPTPNDHHQTHHQHYNTNQIDPIITPIDNINKNPNNNNNHNNIPQLTTFDSLNQILQLQSQFKLQETCASQTNCDECYKVLGCHYCDFDKQCHAYGSIFGCLVGSSCPRPQCIRHEAQFVGYQNPPASFVFSVIGFFFILAIILSFCLHLFCFGCKYICMCCSDQRHINNNNNNNNNQSDLQSPYRSTQEVIVIHAGSGMEAPMEDNMNNSSSPHQQQLNNNNNNNNNTQQLSTLSALSPTTSSNNNNHQSPISTLSIDDENTQTARWITKKPNQKPI